MFSQNVIFFVASLFATSLAAAATLESLSSSPQVLRSVKNQDFIQIEACKGNDCVRYPSDQTLQRMRLSGLSPSWEKIFADCSQFQSLNQLYNYTNTLTTLATFWNVGGIVRGTQTVKYAVSSLGGVGRILGSRIVFDSAVFVAGSQITSLPLQLTSENDLPYPDIHEEDVIAALDFLEVILNDSGHYFLPQNIIEAATQVIGICSSQTYQRAVETHISDCLRGCHNVPTPSFLPGIRQSDSSFKNILPQFDRDHMDLEALKNYLYEN